MITDRTVGATFFRIGEDVAHGGGEVVGDGLTAMLVAKIEGEFQGAHGTDHGASLFDVELTGTEGTADIGNEKLNGLARFEMRRERFRVLARVRRWGMDAVVVVAKAFAAQGGRSARVAAVFNVLTARGGVGLSCVGFHVVSNPTGVGQFVKKSKAKSQSQKRRTRVSALHKKKDRRYIGISDLRGKVRRSGVST